MHLTEDKEFMPFSVISVSASYPDKNILPQAITTTFGHQLREKKWIEINKNFYTRSEVIGIDHASYLNERNIKNGTFNWLVLDYKENQFIFNYLEIAHINSYSTDHMIWVLTFIQKSYASIENKPASNDFKRFYHTILKYLYSTYELRKTDQVSLINKLKQVFFLCINYQDSTEFFSWEKPERILHIDDTKLYQNLSDEVKSRLGYFFTKSDKNEIGKVFNQIAPKLSSRIKEKIVYSGAIASEKLLYRKINNLLYVILLVEDKTEDIINDNMLQKLQQVKLRIVPSITRKTSIVGSDNKQMQLPDIKLSYHFNASENSLYVCDEYSDLDKEKKLFADMVNEVFSVIVQKDFDQKLYIRDLMTPNQSEAFQDAKKDIDYDKNRFDELKEILGENHLNEEQILWDAVVKCKCPENTASPFPWFAQIDWDILSVMLAVSAKQLQQWHNSFEYAQYHSAHNLPLIQEIVQELNLDFRHLNALLSGRLNFEEIYNDWYTRCKNKYADTIKYNVYEILQASDSTTQSRFKAFIDAVDNMNPELSSVSMLFFDVEADVLAKVNNILSSFGYEIITQLDESRNNEWWKLYNSIPLQVRDFKKRLRNKEHADEFIIKDEHYSLLYFNKTIELITKYIQQYPLVEEEDTEASDITASECLLVEDDEKDILTSTLQHMKPTGDPFGALWGQIAPKSILSRGGYKNPALVNNDNAENIGKTGELLMFKKLSKIYEGRVIWVSEYAKEYGHTPDKSAVGYDMHYIDENNDTHYVEVKTSIGNQPEFHITINEIKTAMAYGDRYHVIWITNVSDKNARQYVDLKNIFINFDEDENFFFNSRFKPVLTAFKIAFTLVINEPKHQLIVEKQDETT
ncbi:hypothetical protein EZS27_025207 [termite gut metagenome]|uniref:Protein NO VEIN C-terminal domain-containing protein n=1 Tax=termite gut metagenome TaxID=433724 RepID=A0A5J4QXI3_9ZZZZ